MPSCTTDSQRQERPWRRPRARLCQLALLCAVLLLAARPSLAQPLPATQPPGTLQIIAILIGLVQRQVAIYVPSSYRSGTAVPLVFALHGGGGDASVMYDPDKRIVEYAEAQGFIAIFPNGLPKPGAPAGSTNYYWGDPVNVDYMNQLIDLLMARFAIDSRRVYFIGFSGGAKLCYQLAADPAISARIAAIATVAGEMGGKNTEPPTTAWEIIDPSITGGVPLSALLLQGGEDKKQPAQGGFGEDFDSIAISFRAKVDTWRLFVGTRAGVGATLPGAPARVEATAYTNPANGRTVIAALDPALPHKWPEWNLMGVIWDFFARVPTR